MLTLADGTLAWTGEHPATPLLSQLPAGTRLTAAGPDVAFVTVRLPHGARAARAELRLGRLHGSRFAAGHRYEPFWMRPHVGSDMGAVPVETQVLFVDAGAGRVAVLVPLIDGPARCALQGSGEGLVLVAETGAEGIAVPPDITGLLVAAGRADALHELLPAAARAVAGRLRTTLRTDKPLPAFVNDFGWCTWDAFYQDVSQDKVRDGLESFRATGVMPRFLILDDGWQSEQSFGEVAGRRLTALVPNAKFGNDLSPTVRMAKREFGVRTFLVWHAFQGYWGGISPADLPAFGAREVARAYSPGIRHYWPEADTKWWGRTAGIVPAERAGAFFHAYHEALAAQGVDGVKVDNQAAMEAFAGPTGTARTTFYRACHDALEASVGRHFAGNLINCMSCANDLLYGYQACGLTRTSADFYPAKAETHGLHLWANAFVALWFGEFVWPDWDMFHSQHTHAAFHAAGRVVSGGPVYVSDKPGCHDPALLRRLVLSDGTVLRADRPGVIAAESLFADPTRAPAALKVWTTTRGGAVGLVGVFNCQAPADGYVAPTIDAPMCPADVPPLPAADHYVVYAAAAKTIRVVGREEVVTTTLAPAGWELWSVVPVTRIGDVRIAPLGLITLLTPTAGIVGQSIAPSPPYRLTLTLRDAGRVAIWCDRRPSEMRTGSQGVVPFDYADAVATVELPTGERTVTMTWR
jgi:raffinose synthase